MVRQEAVKRVAKNFGKSSKSYDACARLQRYSGKLLMPWLPNKNNLNVLDLGCGTGFFSELLSSQYQKVVGLDISHQMLDFAKAARSDAIEFVHGNALDLPFEDNHFDLIYSNLVLQWCHPLDKALKEAFRVLKPGGILVFTTLTDGTLFELKNSWAQVDSDKHVIDFLTPQTIAAQLPCEQASLLEHKSTNIVLDYESPLHLAHELKGLGANYVPEKKHKGLSGKESWQKMAQAYSQYISDDGVYPATYSLYQALVVKLNS
jgi:malonyl-CoA O-methyltransferase